MKLSGYAISNRLFESTLACTSSSCGASNTKFDLFSVVHVPLPPLPAGATSIQLTDALASFSAFELVSAKCANCASTAGAKKKLELSGEFLPQLLIVQLKRFSETESSVHTKNSTLVEFALDGLDLGPHVRGCAPGGAVYDCIAMSNHFAGSAGISSGSGGGGSGHYTTHARRGPAAPWYCYDDANPPVAVESPNKANAYVLFFYVYVLFFYAYVLFFYRRGEPRRADQPCRGQALGSTACPSSSQMTDGGV
jgi:ubiquitin C-terminal hydrolase